MRSAPTPIPDPHTPVLLEQVVQVLSPQPGETILDCTVGSAGHTIALAERLAGNGTIVGLHLTAVISAWQTQTGQADYNPDADLDANGVIDGLDLNEVISNWGQ